MKLINISSLIITLAAAACMSQPALHLSGGINISSTTDTDSIPVSSSSRRGFNAGLGFEQSLSASLSVFIGASLETRGEKEEKTEDVAYGAPAEGISCHSEAAVLLDI